MCEYCEGINTEVLLEKEILNDFPIKFNNEIKEDEIFYDNYICYVDRGYLRFVMEDDNQCLGHGLKKKINYCPMCGEELE